MMADWRRSTAQNPMTDLTHVFAQQQGGINTSGRIYGGTTTTTDNTELVVIPVDETNRKNS